MLTDQEARHSDPALEALCPYCHPERAHEMALAEEERRQGPEQMRRFVESEAWLYTR